jgi:hypothetical protein
VDLETLGLESVPRSESLSEGFLGVHRKVDAVAFEDTGGGQVHGFVESLAHDSVAKRLGLEIEENLDPQLHRKVVDDVHATEKVVGFVLE